MWGLVTWSLIAVMLPITEDTPKPAADRSAGIITRISANSAADHPSTNAADERPAPRLDYRSGYSPDDHSDLAPDVDTEHAEERLPC